MESKTKEQNMLSGFVAEGLARRTLQFSVLVGFVLGYGYTQTKPISSGVSLPAACVMGQIFFKTDAASGSNVYGCTARDTWSLQGGQGGGGTAALAAQLGDFGVVAQNPATLLINSNCTTATPCNILVGGVTYAFKAPSRVTISGTVGTGIATIYVSSTGALTLEYPSGITGLSVFCEECTASAIAVPGVPPDAIPVAQAAFSSAGGTTTWGTITDRRAFLSAPLSSAGSPTLSAGSGGGIVVDCVLGKCGASLDTSVAAVQAGDNDFTGNNRLGVGVEGVDFSASNDSMTGTGDKLLAKLTSNGTVIKSSAGDTFGVVGVVLPGSGGTTGFARVRFSGFATCTFDNTATLGDYVQISSATAGQCHDASALKPADGQIVGRVWNVGGNGDNTVLLGLDANYSSGAATVDHAALIHLDYASSGHSGFQPALGFTPVNSVTVGQPNGVAALGSDGKVPAAQLPAGGGGASLGAGAIWDPIPLNHFESGIYTLPPTPQTVYVWKFSVPAAITVNYITSTFIYGSGFGEYTSFGIYDGTCSTLLGQMTPVQSNNQFFSQPLQTPVTLDAGTYYMAATSDGTHNQGYSPVDGNNVYRQFANTGPQPGIAIAQNSAQNSGASLTFPSSCGTLTTAGVDGRITWALRFRN